MKNNILFIVITVFCVILFGSCENMNDKTEKYWGETVYPAKFDTIIGKIGYERVEIDLLKAGRIPASQIMMGKAIKTVIEYDDKKIVLDTLASWINITGLDQPKIYRFFVYTLDEYNNQSVPQEIALIPFTASDLAATVITNPRITTSPSSAIVEWPSGLNSILLTYYNLSFEYTNRDNNVVKGDRGTDSRFFVANIPTGASTTVKMKYKILPKVNNVSILDTLYLEKDLTITTPAASGSFSPTERDVLIANGLTTFTYQAAAAITKLTYPIHANSLQDLFYFSNIKEVDLTGGDLFNVNQYTYTNSRATCVVGGGAFLPFISKVININDIQVLIDLMEAGTLTKVRYLRGSMSLPNNASGLDAKLAPFVGKGVLELVDTPDDVLVPFNYWADGNLQTTDFNIVTTKNPGDAPAGTGLQYVYKMIPKGRSATFIIAVPPDYRYNCAEYKYLKYRVFSPPASDFTGTDANFRNIWLRLMTSIWGSFPGESNFGQEEAPSSADSSGRPYVPKPTNTIADADCQKWTEYSCEIYPTMSLRHTRVICFNIGCEPSNAPSKDMTYFFSNIRFSKTP